MSLPTLNELLMKNEYPGRGIAVGRSEDGECAVLVYFIMGRSVNSRNRIFTPQGEGIRTECFDPDLLTDPSLIIYSPVRVWGNTQIVTNGDQTDTVYDAISRGGSFEDALRSRSFEPDPPNFTPRISAAVTVASGAFFTKMSLIKSDRNRGEETLRYFFEYEDLPKGQARYVHTYLGNGDPLPSFEGEPERAVIEGDIDALTRGVWESLHPENKVSLFVRYVHLTGGDDETRIVNRHP